MHKILSLYFFPILNKKLKYFFHIKNNHQLKQNLKLKLKLKQ